jgi:hypothetical protein
MLLSRLNELQHLVAYYTKQTNGSISAIYVICLCLLFAAIFSICDSAEIWILKNRVRFNEKAISSLQVQLKQLQSKSTKEQDAVLKAGQPNVSKNQPFR